MLAANSNLDLYASHALHLRQGRAQPFLCRQLRVFFVCSRCLVLLGCFVRWVSLLHLQCIFLSDSNALSVLGRREIIISPLPVVIMIMFWVRASHEVPMGTHAYSDLWSPYPLPAEHCKGQSRKGMGETSYRQLYCHACVAVLGEMLSVFFFVFGSAYVVFLQFSS